MGVASFRREMGLLPRQMKLFVMRIGRMSKVSRLALLGALAIFGVGQAASPAAASLLGVDITNPSLANDQLFTNDDETAGYQFAVNSQPVEVTALGVYDGGSLLNLNLSAGPTFVQLWTVGGAALLSNPVQLTDTNTFQDGMFAFVLVTPISLAPNMNYIVASQGYGGIDFALRLDSTDYVVNPYISYVQDEFNQTAGSLNFPNVSTQSEVGVFGGNVELVPEPMSLSIFGFGLAGLGLLRRRKRA
jgi:hypothetical protein